MLKKILLCLLSLSLLSACACAKEAAAPVPAESAPVEAPAQSLPAEAAGAPTMPPEMAEEAAKAHFHAEVARVEELRRFEAADGTLVLEVTGFFPSVVIEGNETATEAVNAFFEAEQAAFLDGEETQMMAADAMELYELNGADAAHLFPFVTERSYEQARLDEDVLSFVCEIYSDTGGAHPNMARMGLRFDAQTGKPLAFADVVEDEAAARAFIEEQLAAMAEADTTGMYFEDYADSLGDILTEDTWYFGEDGFRVIVNPYIITPYAAGIQELNIPYGEFPQLKAKYGS